MITTEGQQSEPAFNKNRQIEPFQHSNQDFHGHTNAPAYAKSKFVPIAPCWLTGSLGFKEAGAFGNDRCQGSDTSDVFFMQV
jgi:hypothetical protein